jgi:hypothetical protein
MEASWGLIAAYILLGLLSLTLVALNPRWVPVLLVLVLPTSNFDLHGPLSLSFSKLVLLIFLVTFPAQYAVIRLRRGGIQVPASVLLFVLVVTLSTLGAYVWMPRASDEGFGLLRSPSFRPIVQVLSLCLRVSALVAILGWAADQASRIRLCKAMLFASTLVAAYGIYQFFGYYYGWPIMSIHRAQADLSDGYALFQVGSLQVFRVGSFAGEPKEAARYLLPSIVLIVFSRCTSTVQLRSWLTSYGILALHVIAFILTFSTSSFFAFFISAPFLFYLLSRYRGRVRLDRLVLVFALSGIVVGSVIAMAGGLRTSSRIYSARITDRVDLIEGPEQAAFDFLKEHPRYLLTGIGLGNSSFALRPYYDPRYYVPLTVSLDSGYLQILLEGGAPALLLFLWFLGAWLKRGVRLVVTGSRDEYTGMLVTIMAVCLVLGAVHAFSGAESQLWIAWGVLVTLCRAQPARVVSMVPNLADPFQPSSSRQISRTRPWHFPTPVSPKW